MPIIKEIPQDNKEFMFSYVYVNHNNQKENHTIIATHNPEYYEEHKSNHNKYVYTVYEDYGTKHQTLFKGQKEAEGLMYILNMAEAGTIGVPDQIKGNPWDPTADFLEIFIKDLKGCKAFFENYANYTKNNARFFFTDIDFIDWIRTVEGDVWLKENDKNYDAIKKIITEKITAGENDVKNRDLYSEIYVSIRDDIWNKIYPAQDGSKYSKRSNKKKRKSRKDGRRSRVKKGGKSRRRSYKRKN